MRARAASSSVLSLGVTSIAGHNSTFRPRLRSCELSGPSAPSARVTTTGGNSAELADVVERDGVTELAVPTEPEGVASFSEPDAVSDAREPGCPRSLTPAPPLSSYHA